AVGRESRRERAGRGTADTIQRQAELGLADGSPDHFRYVSRINDHDISANRLELGHQLRPPDDVYGFQASPFRKPNDPSPNPGISGVLHHPVSRLQVDELAE